MRFEVWSYRDEKISIEVFDDEGESLGLVDFKYNATAYRHYFDITLDVSDYQFNDDIPWERQQELIKMAEEFAKDKLWSYSDIVWYEIL